MIPFNVKNFNFRNLSNYVREFNLLILPIALSTCILTDSMCLPSCTSFAGSHCCPSINEGLFNSTPTSCMSLIVNPQSAITKIPALFCTQFKNPDTPVSSRSAIEPMYNADIKVTQPFGVQAIKNLAMLWCLLHVDDSRWRSVGVAM